MKRRVFHYLYVSILIVAPLLFGEMFMRVYHYMRNTDSTIIISDNEKLIYERKPNLTVVNKEGIEIHYDSLGFMVQEIGTRSPERFRILGVGDSVTYAAALPENQRYLNIVGKMLSDAMGKYVEVINAGIGGYDSWQESELIRVKGLLVEPDLIIVGICLNDFVNEKPVLTKNFWGGVSESVRVGHCRVKYFNWLYMRSDLYRLIYDVLRKMKTGFYGDRGYQQYLREYHFEMSDKEFEAWKKPLLDMRDLARENDIKIIFVVFPLENMLINGTMGSFGDLIDFFKKNRFDYINLFPEYYRYFKMGKRIFISRDPVHPNDLGNRLAAEAIANYMRENDMLGKENNHLDENAVDN